MIAAIERIYRCLMLVFGRGRITFVDDSGAVQMAQVRFSPLEIIDNLPVPHDFGFTSNPPLQSDAFAAFMGGNRKNGLVITIGNQSYRMKNLKSGEVAIYDNVGQSVYLTQAGIVINGGNHPVTINNTPKVIVNATAEIDLNTPVLKVSGKITAGGDITATGDISATGTITAPNVVGSTNVSFGGKSGILHTHSGVQTGTGNTGAPN